MLEGLFDLIAKSHGCIQRGLKLCLQHSPSASIPTGLPGADLRLGVEVLLGVGASERDVGELDLDTGVVDFSFYNKKRHEIR